MATVISRGMITAVPIACATRAPSMMGKVGARAAMTVPIRKIVVAKMNTTRVVNRSRIQPVAGSTTAMVSMNPVSSHWAVFASME